MVAVGGLYLLVTLSVVLFAVQGQNCSRPQDGAPNTVLTSADILKNTFPDKAYATWECEIGYQWRGGVRNQTCNAGTWNPAIVAMKCERRSCSSIENQDNGRIEYLDDGNQFGDKAELICDPGHHYVGGQKIISCGADGNWDGRFGRCDVETCEKPEDILNGKYSPVTENYVYRDVVTYKCNKDYTLDGSSQIHCEDEQFRPAPPKCIMVECETPNVPHLRRVTGLPPPYKHKYHVTFECDPGFDLSGSDSATCEISGWTPPLPTCRLRAVPTPPTPPRTPPTTTTDPPIPSPSPPPPNPVVWIVLGVSFVIIIITGGVAYKYYTDKKRSPSGYSGNVAIKDEEGAF